MSDSQLDDVEWSEWNATDSNTTIMALKETGFYIYFSALAVIIPLGLVCNSFSIGVFVTADKFRRTSTGQLLIALSVVDSLVLVGDALKWINSKNNHLVYVTGLKFIDMSFAACSSVYILRYSTKLMSAWLTVAISLERLAVVALPLDVGRLSTPCRARVVVVIIVVVCVPLCLFPLWTFDVTLDPLRCIYAKEVEYDRWVTAIIRVGTFCLPSLLLVILSSLIVHFMRKSVESRPPSTYGRKSGSTRHAKDPVKSTQRQMTMMLVMICVAAVCLQLPYIVCYFVNVHKDQYWPRDDDRSRLWRAGVYVAKVTTEALATLSYAVDFFLYCFSGTTFRRLARRMLSCQPRDVE